MRSNFKAKRTLFSISNTFSLRIDYKKWYKTWGGRFYPEIQQGTGKSITLWN